MTESLSSRATPLFKFFLAPFLPLAVAAFALSLPAEATWQVVVALAIAALAAFLAWRYLLPLKHVVAIQGSLIVSNYRTSITVPYTEIESVLRVNEYWDVVRIAFRSETPFGSAILFMASFRLFRWSEHPVVGNLKRRAGLTLMPPSAGT